jgi:hypothetical protein
MYIEPADSLEHRKLLNKLKGNALKESGLRR